MSIKQNIKNCIKPFIEDLNRKIYKTYSEPSVLGKKELSEIDKELEILFSVDNIKRIFISRKEIIDFENKWNLKKYYGKKYHRYERKLAEYYIVSLLCNFSERPESFVYIDAASKGSPWAKKLKDRYGIKAFSVDI